MEKKWLEQLIILLNIFMGRNRFILFVWCVWLSLALSAQMSVSMNENWQFQRLSEKQHGVEIKNQGSDWSSQFNIQHIEGRNGNLAINPDTLRMEFDKLSNGQWENVRLPHTSFVEPLVVLNPWQGICYYRKKFDISSEWVDKELWLEFEGAMHLADVWVNGRYVVQHAGGYTPFVLNLTGMLRLTDNEILVRLDNRNNSLVGTLN